MKSKMLVEKQSFFERFLKTIHFIEHVFSKIRHEKNMDHFRHISFTIYVKYDDEIKAVANRPIGC